MSKTAPVLVIGYGSELRGDDAVGRRIAEAVAAWNLPGVRALSVHQLTPELAEPISQAAIVYFADASIAPATAEPVRLQALEQDPGAGMNGHVCNPRTLLALAQMLYGRSPAAYWLTIPAVQFAMGDTLSEAAERGVAAALKCLRVLLGSFQEVCMGV